MKISVIMSVYNSEKTVRAAIESILNQTFNDFEFLIIDDNSSDNTYKICNEYSTLSNIRIYKNSSNLGLTKSLNILIKKSKGEYIARQDADDYSKLDRLEKQLKILQKKKVEAVTSRAFIQDSNKIRPRYLHLLPKKIVLLYKNPFIHGTLIIKKSLLQKINRYDEDYIFAQDYKLFCDIYKNNYKVYTIRQPLYFLNIKNNISSINKFEQNYFSLKAREYFRDNES